MASVLCPGIDRFVMSTSLFPDIEPGERIGAIGAPASDASLRRIRVGRRIVATLPADAVEAMGIAIGDVWTAPLAATLRQAMTERTVRRHAQRLLKRRPYSRSELVDRLMRKEPDGAMAKRIANEMIAAGAIDDEAYARVVAVSVADRGPVSVTYLKHKLRQRGIPPELAQRVAGETLEESNVVETAVAFAAARLRSMSSQPPDVAARRIWSALARRGLDADTIRIVLDRINVPAGELEDSDDFEEVRDEHSS